MSSYWTLLYAFMLSAVLTGLLIIPARALGWVDKPDHPQTPFPAGAADRRGCHVRRLLRASTVAAAEQTKGYLGPLTGMARTRPDRRLR